MPVRPLGDVSPEKSTTAAQGRLRILETSDLHMHILGYDYFSDQPDQRHGLVHLVDHITTLRADQGTTTLLFDNGDFLQGNPMADYLIDHPQHYDIHPMIGAFNTLGYDAIGLGNHEFNFGVPVLADVLKTAACPVLCTNITYLSQPPFTQPYTILDRDITCSDGTVRSLRIGVLSFLPPQINTWDSLHLQDKVQATDILAAAKSTLPEIKAKGADLVIALCHSGIQCAKATDGMENAAIPLAALDGIDVLLTGHIHDYFPGPWTNTTAVDAASGTLHDKPTVMPGFYGNHLGVIDLDLSFCETGVKIASHSSRLEKAAPCENDDKPVLRALHTSLQDIHLATLHHIRQPITRTDVHLQSYFAMVRDDQTLRLTGRAQSRAASSLLAGTDHADLPMLAATAPFRCGGRAGPHHYIDIPPGAIVQRDVSALYPFSNKICVLRRTGAQLREWLEWSASRFYQIVPDSDDQPLLNPQFPAYFADMLYGLTYLFDLTVPPRFGPDRTLLAPASNRVRDLRYNGTPVSDTDLFAVATNNYRAGGGGTVSTFPDEDKLAMSTITVRDALVTDLRQAGGFRDSNPDTWRFAPIKNASATFLSAPTAKDHISGAISHVGPARDGFDLYKLTF